MSDLSKRVKNLHSRSKNVGRDYVLLFVECVETMSDNWTPMAELIGGANPKDSATLRKMSGFVLTDWKLAKDTKHRSGLRFAKGKAATFDADKLSEIKALAEQGHVLQGKVIADMLQGDKPVEVKKVSAEDLAKAYVKSAHLKMDSGAVSTADALSALRMAVKALEAELAAEIAK